jgi:hypothetical protein
MDRQQIRSARGWCAECFDDYPADATDAEVERCIARQYVGGVAQFIADGEY